MHRFSKVGREIIYYDSSFALLDHQKYFWKCYPLDLPIPGPQFIKDLINFPPIITVFIKFQTHELDESCISYNFVCFYLDYVYE